MKHKRKKLLERQFKTCYHISQRETWNGDDTLARFVRDLLRKFVKYNNGWPNTEQFPTFESYQAKLTEIADACDQYSMKDNISRIPINSIRKQKYEKYAKNLFSIDKKTGKVTLADTDKELDDAFKVSNKIEDKIISNYISALKELAELAPGIWW